MLWNATPPKGERYKERGAAHQQAQASFVPRKNANSITSMIDPDGSCYDAIADAGAAAGLSGIERN